MRLFTVFFVLIFTLTGCVEMIYDMRNKTKALAESELLKKKAFDGDVEAQYRLGKMYCCGESPAFDNVQALRWWCVAAKGDQRDAMLEVGKLYETSHKYKGSIIPRNNVLAYTYYQKAVDNGNDDAIEFRDNIKESLSKDEMHNASYLLKQWPVIGCEISR